MRYAGHDGLTRASSAIALFALLVGCSGNANEPAGPTGDPSPGSNGGSAQGGAGSGLGGSGTGTSSGGSNASGGTASGGVTGSGGTSTGGSSAGGNTNTGGTSTGGANPGGTNTGGSAGAPSGGSGGGAGSGGSSSGGSAGSAGAGGNSDGSGGAGGSGVENPGAGDGPSPLGSGMMMGSGRTEEQYQSVPVSRDGMPYILITNGWGPGFGGHAISWNGTSFTVETMNGTTGPRYEPASFPTVFCGLYSVMEVPDCGLPAPLDSIESLRTGWRWAKNGNEGEYNASYDIWLGDGRRLQAYLMVWLRDPPGQQPAGQPNQQFQNITVAGLPGAWNIWNGMVNGLPIVNYVRAEGADSYKIEFDVMDVVRDMNMRGLSLPGNSVNAVAAGFEIWKGPIMNLQSVDFYVDVQKN
nr:MAG: hypothetical protein DIU78_15530 [Pseudomonadota bacterium]